MKWESLEKSHNLPKVHNSVVTMYVDVQDGINSIKLNQLKILRVSYVLVTAWYEWVEIEYPVPSNFRTWCHCWNLSKLMKKIHCIQGFFCAQEAIPSFISKLRWCIQKGLVHGHPKHKCIYYTQKLSDYYIQSIRQLNRFLLVSFVNTGLCEENWTPLQIKAWVSCICSSMWLKFTATMEASFLVQA